MGSRIATGRGVRVTIEFTCKLCGRRHPVVSVSEPGLSSEERERVGVVWRRTIEDPNALDGFELKLSLKYFGALPKQANELPPTITTSKGPDGFYFHCAGGCDA